MNVLATAYSVVRLPSLVAQATLLTRLPVENPARLGVEKLLGTVDVLAGRVLADPDLVERGSSLVDRSGAVGDAEVAFAAPEVASTSALMPEIAPPAPAAVEAAAENSAPEPTMASADTGAAKQGIAAVHQASTQQD